MATEDLDRYTPKNWQFLCGVVVEYCKRVFWRLKRLLCEEGTTKCCCLGLLPIVRRLGRQKGWTKLCMSFLTQLCH